MPNPPDCGETTTTTTTTSTSTTTTTEADQCAGVELEGYQCGMAKHVGQPVSCPAPDLSDQFADRRLGGAAVGGVVEADSFHAESRTLVDSGKADKAAARRVYERSVCLLDAAEAERQVASLLCARITTVREALQSEPRWPGLE